MSASDTSKAHNELIGHPHTAENAEEKQVVYNNNNNNNNNEL